jgi:hypothetical protein
MDHLMDHYYERWYYESYINANAIWLRQARYGFG